MEENQRKVLEEKYWAILSEYFSYSQGNLIQASKRTADQLEKLNPNLEAISRALQNETDRIIAANQELSAAQIFQQKALILNLEIISKVLKSETDRVIASNQSLGEAQARQQNAVILANRILVGATIIYVAFAGWSAYETKTANNIQRQNQQNERQIREEYKTVILENLAEDIDINLSLISELEKQVPASTNAAPLGRFHTYYLEKIKDVYVKKEIRRASINLLNDLSQANRNLDALQDINYQNYFDVNLERLKAYVQPTKEKLLNLKKALEDSV